MEPSTRSTGSSLHGRILGELKVLTSLPVKELIPIVIAIALWGRNWTGQVVQCRCDNSAVVAVLASRTSKDQDLMHLLRCLALFEAKLSVRVIGAHLPGAQNTLADNLSRDALSSFLQASAHS